jgi:hypothetical protein
MIIDYSRKLDFCRLRAAVKGFGPEGTAIRKEINKSKGSPRHQLRLLKQSLGSDARYVYVVYGMLKGIPYKKIEPKCINLPASYNMKQVLDKYCSLVISKEYDELKIKAWLNGEPVSDVATAA